MSAEEWWVVSSVCKQALVRETAVPVPVAVMVTAPVTAVESMLR